MSGSAFSRHMLRLTQLQENVNFHDVMIGVRDMLKSINLFSSRYLTS